MTHHLQKFRDFLTHGSVPQDPIKKWEYLQALGRVQYMIDEASRGTFAFLFVIVVALMTFTSFTFREFFEEMSWTYRIQILFFFLMGMNGARKSWKQAEQEYQAALDEARTRALAQSANASPVSTAQNSTTPSALRRP